MKKLFSFLLLAGILICGANAQVLVTNFMDGYTVGDDLEKGVYTETTDPIAAFTWKLAKGASGGENPKVVAPLSYEGYTQGGNAVLLDDDGSSRLSVFSLDDDNTNNDGEHAYAGTVYLAFLFNSTAAAVFDTGAQDIVCFDRNYTAGYARSKLFIGKEAEEGIDKLVFGIAINGARDKAQKAAGRYDFGQTHLVVMKYDIPNKTASIFINPAITETEPTADAVDSQAGAAYIASVTLRKRKNFAATVGGFRLADNWKDAVGYEESKIMENTGNNTDAVFTGTWDEATFTTFVQANAVNLTTIDLTGVTGDLSQIPATSGLNPNCLLYVNTGVTGSNGQNLINFNGSTYSGNISLVEASESARNNSFNNTHEFTGEITYTRDFSNAQGKYATICLPFAPTNPGELTGLEFEAFDKVTIEGEQANLNYNTIEASALQANTPYIVKIGATTTEITFKGSSVPATSFANPPASEGYSFNGNYRYNDAITTYYLLRSDGSEFAKGSENSYITAFRAYLTTDNTGRKHSVLHDGETTGIDARSGAEQNLGVFAESSIIYIDARQQQTVHIYSLDGRIVRTIELNIGRNSVPGLSKGIYLIDTQKVVNK